MDFNKILNQVYTCSLMRRERDAAIGNKCFPDTKIVRLSETLCGIYCSWNLIGKN